MATKKPKEDPKKSKGGDSKGDARVVKKGPVRSMMVGESPGEDLGYDPDTIPTEDIPDDD